MEHDLHKPVLLDAVLHYLAIKPNGIYVDATFGRGGHTRGILQQLAQAGRLLAMDKDHQAIAYAREHINDPRFMIKQGSFTGLQTWIEQLSLVDNIDGILLDLGVSSPQLDDPQRGFSFMRDGPLDMRMNQETGMSAQQWISEVSESHITEVLRDYGEERYAGRIAKAIIEARACQPINTTKQLADIVAKAHPRWQHGKHPATRTFQAIRIEINQELTELQSALEQCYQCLKVGGRLLVLSFHSLEHRMVKQFLRQRVEKSQGIQRSSSRRADTTDGKHFYPESQGSQSMRSTRTTPRIREIAKVSPERSEIRGINPRARSAMLRVGEKIQ